MIGVFVVFGELIFEMFNCYFIFINYLYLRFMIVIICILNMYYYKVLKYLVVCLFVFEKKKIENGIKFDIDIVLIKMLE